MFTGTSESSRVRFMVRPWEEGRRKGETILLKPVAYLETQDIQPKTTLLENIVASATVPW